IQTYGLVDHPRYGRIYAYETDGYGNYSLMDDANVPSLLSIPYLGYRPANDPLYANTRRFVLSSDNPYYYEGEYARGVGSPHTPPGYIWHIALSMQGLTSIDDQEQEEILRMLMRTTGGTHYMHESFDPDNPQRFTRPWFAWANSLFGEFIYHLARQQPDWLTRLREM
ncbi:MAG: glycoside hydrolase family 125 protein, partial [Ktedonobacteraceae bacterium]|nr:glycoside hydrolase family 125 protein [Ktedonobacteraceae bacterium]